MQDRANGAQQGEAVEAGHHDIGQEQIRKILAKEFESLVAITGDDEIVIAAENAGDVVAHIGVIVSEQNARASGGIRGLAGVVALAGESQVMASPVKASACGLLSAVLSARACDEPPNGTETVKVLPLPGWLATEISPPCSFTSSWVRARPMPVPS